MSGLFRLLLLLAGAGALVPVVRHISRRHREQRQPIFADPVAASEPARFGSAHVMALAPAEEEHAEAWFVADVQQPALMAEPPSLQSDTWSGRALGS